MMRASIDLIEGGERFYFLNRDKLWLTMRVILILDGTYLLFFIGIFYLGISLIVS